MDAALLPFANEIKVSLDTFPLQRLLTSHREGHRTQITWLK